MKLKYLIITIIALSFTGCATLPARSYKLNCVDYASAAGHAYEHIWGGPVLVCIGKRNEASKFRHAQAVVLEAGRLAWLDLWFESIDSVYLVLDAPAELDLDLGVVCMPLRKFDDLMRWKLE